MGISMPDWVGTTVHPDEVQGPRERSDRCSTGGDTVFYGNPGVGLVTSAHMEFSTHVWEHRWATIARYGLFVALMVAGYYNITFVQLGLIDVGTRLVGMSETAVSMWMAALALATLVVAAVTGHCTRPTR